MDELKNIMADIRSGALSFSCILPFLIAIIARKMTGRYALPHDECGPVIANRYQSEA